MSTPFDRMMLPIQHASTAGKVQTDRTARALNAVVGTARLAAKGFDSGTIDELFKFQSAILARYRALGETWTGDWAAWYDYATHLKGTNTMSKLAERESNIACRLAQMIGSQIQDLVTLQENVEVNYICWLTRKL
jgi:hypothetical protein